MRAYIEKELERYQVPGLGLAVIKEDQVILCEGFGFRDLAKKTPVTPKTQFGIASCSKSFTAAVIAMLADEGLLTFDTPLKEYFPDFKLYDPIAEELCTIQDLLTHRTGVAGHDALWVDEIDRGELWKRLEYIRPNAPFRSAAQYSNLMYTMAGHVAEKLTGKTWDALIYERIFQPLGMENSNTSIDDMLRSPDYAMPYWQGADGPVPIRNWNVDLGGPAASINSCLEDMARWVRFQMNGGVWNGKRLISEENMEKLHLTHTPYHLWPWKYEELATVGGYGLGWFTDVYRGREMVFHYGEIEGYCSLQAYLPKEKIGAVCMVNLHKPCTLILNSVWYTVIDKLLGLEPIDWAERFAQETGKYGRMYEHWDVNLLPQEPVGDTKLSHKLCEYAGCYHDPGYGNFEITVEGDGLMGYYRGMKQPIDHYHYDTFKVPDIKMDTLLYTAPLTFLTDPCSGEIDSFLIPLEPRVQPILFKKQSKP